MRNLSGTADSNIRLKYKLHTGGFAWGFFIFSSRQGGSLINLITLRRERRITMETQLKDVAARIRELRTIAGLTEADMAARTEITEEQYRILEQGETDFGFTFIYKCADIFGVEIKDLLEGSSPVLSLYTVTRKGEGLPIARKSGFTYHHLAPEFRSKIAEPFWVKIPYTGEGDMSFSSHEGQEIDIVIKGRVKVQIRDRVEILNAGDTIYYNSGEPHAICAVDGKDAELYAVVLRPDSAVTDEPAELIEVDYQPQNTGTTVADDFIECETDKDGVLTKISFKNEDTFNFAFDCVDRIAEKCPDKTAMLWISGEKKEHRFTFADMKKYSNMTANYLESIGIRKGDRVMLVLKRHYQFWFAMLALHKIGAIAIPALRFS